VHDPALTEPGLIVYRFDAPLVFPDAAFFTERLEELIANAGAGLMKRLGAEHAYPSVRAAVDAYHAQFGR
jgi:hypothetical protein